jgi:hypothetical protein
MFGIDAIIQAIHRETERYRDSKKKEKEQIRDAFVKLKTALNTAIIQIELTVSYGSFDVKQIRLYLPEIALNINKTAVEIKDILGLDIYNGLIGLAENVVEINQKANSLTFGVGIEDEVKQLVSNLKDLRVSVEMIEKI